MELNQNSLTKAIGAIHALLDNQAITVVPKYLIVQPRFYRAAQAIMEPWRLTRRTYYFKRRKG